METDRPPGGPVTTIARDLLERPPVRAARPAAPAGSALRARGLAGGVSAGAAAVGVLWLRAADLSPSPGSWVTELGRLAGLLGGYAVVVLVVLMARVPAVERGVGADRLARWHARGGRVTVVLLTAHAALITWGYALTARRGLAGEAWTLVTRYPDVLAATVALGLFLGVAAASVRAARRRMAYETWYWLHFYTYLATALAFAHTFATGSAFVDDRLARVLWSALYALAAVAVAWRFVAPVGLAWRHRVRVAAVHPEAPGVVSVELSGRRLDRLGARAGQFVRLRVLDADGWWQSHPYSLSAPVSPGRMRVTVKDLGDESRRLAGLRPGTRVSVEGPYGALTAAVRTRPKVLLLAAGIGITPLRALFEELPGDVVLVHRASRSADLALRAEVDHLATAPGRTAHHVVGPRGGPRDVTHPAGLLALVPDVADRDVYLCGPAGFTVAARSALRAAGVPDRQVHEESFALEPDMPGATP